MFKSKFVGNGVHHIGVKGAKFLLVAGRKEEVAALALSWRLAKILFVLNALRSKCGCSVVPGNDWASSRKVSAETIGYGFLMKF
ncbi:MAG: hypothetical protein ACKVUS_04960 [Saprospiraceae bacterium]